MACSYCGEDGHNIVTCPKKKGEDAEKAAVVPAETPAALPPDPPPPSNYPMLTYILGRISALFKAGGEKWDELLKKIPKLSKWSALAGFIFISIAFGFRSIAPESVLGLQISGFLGIWLFIFAILAYIVNFIQKSHRGIVLVVLALIFSLVTLEIVKVLTPLILPPKAVSTKVTVDKMPQLNLEDEGFPALLTISVADEEYPLNLNKQGEQTLKLPARASQFTIKDAIWHGFTLKSDLNKPLEITGGQIVIPFSQNEDFTRKLTLNEFFRLGRRHFHLDNDRELIGKLGLKELPDEREETTELADCVVKVRNESSRPIIPTFVDCDDLIWGNKKVPDEISGINIGTHMIDHNTTCDHSNPFLAKSAYNKTFALLVCWQKKSGTDNRYCLAGFVVLRPEPLGNRVYHITITGDAQNVSLKDNPPNDNVRVIR